MSKYKMTIGLQVNQVGYLPSGHIFEEGDIPEEDFSHMLAKKLIVKVDEEKPSPKKRTSTRRTTKEEKV